MLTDQSNSELGRHLLTIRGVQFIFGAQGDPLALLLRAGEDDPLSHGERARERGLHESSIGAWVTANRELGAKVLSDPMFSPRHPEEGPQHHPGVDVWENPQLCHVIPLDAAQLNLDPAAYDELAAAAQPLLGVAALAGRRAEIERAHREILAGVGERFDLFHDFAVPAAVRVVSDVLGLPAESRERLAAWHAGLAVALDAGQCPQQLATTRALFEALDGVTTELSGLIADGRATGLAALTGASSQEKAAIGVLAVVAGIEVTATALCNTVELLLENPAAWDRVRQAPDLVEAAVREALRCAPPLRFESRVAREQVELDGQKIEVGKRVVVLVQAANRDPDSFDDPNTFDLDRTDGDRQLTLLGGVGTVVAPLVRIQTEAALRVLTEARPRLRCDAEVLRRMRSAVLGGILRFSVS